MPDDKKPAAKKKGTRTALAVGAVALVVGIGYFWVKSRQGGGSAQSTDTTGGVTGSGFTDMGDIIQTVQGPPGKTGATGKTGARGKAGPPGKDDDDDKKKRRRKRRAPIGGGGAGGRGGH